MQIQTQKTTIELDKQLINLAKMQAIKEGKTLKDIITDGLKNRLGLQDQTKKGKSPTVKIGGHKLGGIIGSLHRADLYEDF